MYRGGMRLEVGDLYCGRGSNGMNVRVSKRMEWGWLGNCFGLELGREKCIRLYSEFLLKRLEEDVEFNERFWSLKGKVKRVLCWCREDESCHADVVRVLLE